MTELEPNVDLQGRTAVVTGGTSGIGRATSIALGMAGADVVVADIRSAPAEDVPSVLEEFENLAAEAEFVKTDVTDEGAVESLFDATTDRFGSVDILISNAGVFMTGSVTDMSAEDWQQELAVNLTGVFHCCKHGLPELTAGDSASIVNVSSVYGIRGGVANFGYTATKGGVLAVTKQLAVEYGPAGVRTNTVLPGFIETRMLDDDTPDETESFALKNTPQGRLGTPEDVATTIRFLVSDQASFINGQALAVDGGFLGQ